MAEMDIQECIKEIEILLPKIAQGMQFSTVTEYFDLGQDITMSQFSVLLVISRNNGCSMSSLASEMSLSGGTITGLVDRLEKQQLVKRKHGKTDRRAVSVWLDAKGKKFVNAFQEKKTEYFKTILERVGAENRERFIDSLRIMDQTIMEFLKGKNN